MIRLTFLIGAIFFSHQLLAAPPIDIRSITDLNSAMASGTTTSVQITQEYLNRIAEIDRNGPRVNAVIALNPDALAQAQALDDERRGGTLRGALHGVPILLKDNIETDGDMPTTAGSLALRNNITRRDATLVAKLRAAGAVILGKTNLSEWANIRSEKSTSGWSAVGGLTKNPHALRRNACGSSSGSGAAMAAGLAAATVGTETDGSITCPASANGVVGFKPTMGLVSRRYIVPISHTQDTAGPLTGSVRDAAILLTAMAGSDPADIATSEADARRVDYAAALSADGLKGVRVGIVEPQGSLPALINAAARRLERAGAIVTRVSLASIKERELGEAEFKILLVELKSDLATYLSDLPAGAVAYRTLADIIAFNKANEVRELGFFGQDIFEQAQLQKGLDDPEYRTALETVKRLSTVEGLDALFANNKIDVLVGQSGGPAWKSTLGKGDAFTPPSLSQLPATAGYPHLTVPMGAANGLPIGLSFIGLKWTDALVLTAGYAFEVAGKPLRILPRFKN